MRIPSKGAARAEVFAALEDARAGDLKWRSGKVWAYVYNAGEEIDATTKGAFAMYLGENGLDPTVFPSLLKLENDVVSMVADHLNAPTTSAGSFTSGGTESIILAMKCARDKARKERPHITRPHVVLPNTAHASFHKAAHYLGMELTVTGVDPSFRADVSEMRDAITDQTVLLVGSAVSYAHGVIDPITDIAALAAERDLLCHVDGCIGAFVLPYFARLGATVQPFDFSVAGVTSISCDLHKYAFAPKGASVLVYRDKALRRHQLYACSNWSGYTVINNTVQSTKSGGPLAGAWAALHAIGDEGYVELCRNMLEGTRRICDAIRAHDDLFLLAEPDSNLVAVGSNTIDVFHLVDEMKTRGWYIQPQLSYGGSPKNFHLSVHPRAPEWCDQLMRDLSECIEAVRDMPSGHMAALVSGMMASASGGEGAADACIPPDVVEQLLAAVGVDGTSLPERMAPINELLDALPSSVREDLLCDFVNELYMPE